MTLNIITVTLNLGKASLPSRLTNTETLLLDAVNFLGISIVGQSDKAGASDGGIYVGSIMKG